MVGVCHQIVVQMILKHLSSRTLDMLKWADPLIVRWMHKTFNAASISRWLLSQSFDSSVVIDCNGTKVLIKNAHATRHLQPIHWSPWSTRSKFQRSTPSKLQLGVPLVSFNLEISNSPKTQSLAALVFFILFIALVVL